MQTATLLYEPFIDICMSGSLSLPLKHTLTKYNINFLHHQQHQISKLHIVNNNSSKCYWTHNPSRRDCSQHWLPSLLQHSTTALLLITTLQWRQIVFHNINIVRLCFKASPPPGQGAAWPWHWPQLTTSTSLGDAPSRFSGAWGGCCCCCCCSPPTISGCGRSLARICSASHVACLMASL